MVDQFWPAGFNVKVWPDLFWPGIESSTGGAAAPEHKAYKKIVGKTWR